MRKGIKKILEKFKISSARDKSAPKYGERMKDEERIFRQDNRIYRIIIFVTVHRFFSLLFSYCCPKHQKRATAVSAVSDL